MHIKGVRGTESVNLKNGFFEIVGLKNEIKFRKKSSAISFDPKSNGDTEKLFGK